MAKFLSQLIIQHRLKMIFLSFTCICILYTGMGNIQFTNEYQAQFGKDNPQLMAYNELIDQYEQEDSILIVIQPKSGNVFNPNILDMVNTLTEES